MLELTFISHFILAIVWGPEEERFVPHKPDLNRAWLAIWIQKKTDLAINKKGVDGGILLSEPLCCDTCYQNNHKVAKQL